MLLLSLKIAGAFTQSIRWDIFSVKSTCRLPILLISRFRFSRVFEIVFIFAENKGFEAALPRRSPISAHSFSSVAIAWVIQERSFSRGSILSQTQKASEPFS